MDPSGQLQSMRNVSAEYQEARFSHDGTRLLLTISDGAQSDIWSYDIASDGLTRLTFYEDNDRGGLWSPDGTHIVYASWQPDVGTFNLFVQRVRDRGGRGPGLTRRRRREGVGEGRFVGGSTRGGFGAGALRGRGRTLRGGKAAVGEPHPEGLLVGGPADDWHSSSRDSRRR